MLFCGVGATAQFLVVLEGPIEPWLPISALCLFGGTAFVVWRDTVK